MDPWVISLASLAFPRHPTPQTPEIAELRGRIERKTKKQAKLKASITNLLTPGAVVGVS